MHFTSRTKLSVHIYNSQLTGVGPSRVERKRAVTSIIEGHETNGVGDITGLWLGSMCSWVGGEGITGTSRCTNHVTLHKQSYGGHHQGDTDKQLHSHNRLLRSICKGKSKDRNIFHQNTFKLRELDLHFLL